MFLAASSLKIVTVKEIKLQPKIKIYFAQKYFSYDMQNSKNKTLYNKQ